jgi:hypothetical protein
VEYVQRVRGRLTIALLVCAAAIPAMTVADAAAYSTTMRGGTDEGHKARLTVDEQLRAQRAVIHWSGRCRGGGVFRTATAIDFRTELLEPGFFALRAGYRTRDHGYRFRIRIRMTGREMYRFDPDDIDSLERWGGGFSARVKVRGRATTTCRAKESWEVSAYPKLPQETSVGTLHMDSDDGDHVGGGQTWDYTAPPGLTGDGDRIEENIDASLLELQFDTWSLRFASPKGQPFAPGVTYPAKQLFLSGDDAGLQIAGDGRGCGGITGEITIHSISFDQWGDLIAVHLSFEQHCGGQEPALRGTVSYNRGF